MFQLGILNLVQVLLPVLLVLLIAIHVLISLAVLLVLLGILIHSVEPVSQDTIQMLELEVASLALELICIANNVLAVQLVLTVLMDIQVIYAMAV